MTVIDNGRIPILVDGYIPASKKKCPYFEDCSHVDACSASRKIGPAPVNCNEARKFEKARLKAPITTTGALYNNGLGQERKHG